MWLVWSIMADETIWEEGKEGVILMTLHNCRPGDFTRNELVVCQLSKMVSVLGHLVTWQAWTEPLQDISVVSSLHINGIHLILIEMSVVFLWQLNVLSILTKVHFD